jgi:Zn-dependent peptidase ImmA (M78 family)
VQVDAVTFDGDATGALELGAVLLAKLVKYFEETLEITLVPLGRDVMQGDAAALNTDGFLKYFEKLNATERLEKFAHELGHKLMHRRLSDRTVPVDPLYTSIYGEAGTIALTRYSKRMREEAEANAFAQEFMCPSDVVFAAWHESDAATTESLAAQLGVPEQIVRVQLANALHELAVGRKEVSTRRTVTYTDEQDRAARHMGTPALVDAGPGTGKTATLIRRLEYLIDRGRDPSQILVLTFSNEAALELLERISTRFGDRIADAMTISTFHGFGMELLHVHGGSAARGGGYEPGFGLMEDDGQVELMTELIGCVPCPNLKPMSDPASTAQAVVEHINHCKHRLRSVESLDEAIRQWHLPATQAVPEVKGASKEVKTEAKRIKKENEERDKEEERRNASMDLLALYREYERVKLERQRVDFADLILLPLQLLEQHEEIRAIYRKKYPWVLVDEFQDVTRATSRLLQAICGKENPPWVVGDARQAIYQFLGADADNVRAMERDFPDVTRYSLKENYRSTEPIVETANDLARLLGGDDRGWRAASDERPLAEHPVAIAEATSDLAEARGVVEQVKNWIERDGVVPSDIAILARRHVDVRNIVIALTEERITAQAAGMMTAEGAAGDMSVVLTLADRPAPSLPRLAYALVWRRRRRRSTQRWRFF